MKRYKTLRAGDLALCFPFLNYAAPAKKGHAVWNPGNDVRLALRRQARALGATAAVVLTLALGIGCATAVLTVAQALLLRRLPMPQQDRLIVLDGQPRDVGVGRVPLGLESMLAFAKDTRALTGVAMLNFEGAAPVTILEGDRVIRLQRSLVTGNFFAVLGVKPLLGRALLPEDDVRGAAPVVVISQRAWRTHFADAPDIVGRRITTSEDGLTSTIVGVMPVGAEYPRGVDAWTPVRMVIPAESMGYLAFDAIGRLAPDATMSQAVGALTQHFQREGSSRSERRLRGEGVALTEVILGNTRPALIAVMAASGLLLLITCLNIANLLVVQALSRRHDLTVRLMLGASRGRIFGEVLAEHALLALAGGVFGGGVAVLAVRLFLVIAPVGLPRVDEIHVNWTMLCIALVLAGLTMLLASITPAWWAVRADARLISNSASVTSAGSRHSSGRQVQFMRELLVGAQVSLALLVLFAAGLVGRSLLKLQRVDLAFDAAGVAVAELAIPPGQYEAPDRQAALYERLQSGLEALPGINGVSPVVTVPFAEMSGWKGRPAFSGQSESEARNNPWVDFEIVSPNFFRTLGLPVTAGRAFTNADREGAPLVAVLSASAARHYWPATNAIGQRLQVGSTSAPREVTVIGVVPDPRYRALREPSATMYFPVRQSFFPFAAPTLVLRTTRKPFDVAVAIRSLLARSDPTVALVRVQPFEALMAGPLAEPRMNALLLAVFAAAAMILSAVGLFGVLATTVRQRTREFGIRMALGATTTNVVGIVVRRAMIVTAGGIAVGMIGAVVTNRTLSSLLFEVGPLDAVTFVGVVLLVLGVSGVSAVLPARAIGRIHPASALRE